PFDISQQKAPYYQTIKVGGMVKEGSLKHLEGMQKEFVVSDYKNELIVKFKGILPDLFKENQGMVATGILKKNGVFYADEILAKHDESYMPKEVYDSLAKRPLNKD
ncbi:MAG: cytochrome c biosis protein CcmE, partial [Francisellaceae bacterium]|nr:cytochrome c biosis protein CcmE [Francisellaceae bacterium]